MNTLTLSSQDALLIVDVQNDFLPGGALAVPQGDNILAPLNQVIAQFDTADLPIFLSRDWHPTNHCSFVAQGGPWPPHCQQNTVGAAFPATLHLPENARIISKAQEATQDAYSAFEGTDLTETLHQHAIQHLFIGGLATDYCVKATVLDALKAGIAVTILSEGIAGLSVTDSEAALKEMMQAGARLV